MTARRLAAFLAAALGGCAATEETGDATIAKLVGEPLAAAVQVLGADYVETSTGEDGLTRYTWHLVEQVLAPGTRGPPTLGANRHGPTYTAGRRSAPRVVAEVCNVHVDVGESDRIVGWLAQGQACGEILRARWP